MKKKKPITNSYSNKEKLNNIEKKYSFSSIDNPIKQNLNFSNNSKHSKDFSNNSVRFSSNYLNELEQSMLELKNYIEIVAPSNSETIESIANKLTFRPKNLPKKSKEEEEYHRKLVEENRRLYLESLQKKQMKELEYKKRLEKKMIKMQNLSKIWVNEIIPNWTTSKSLDEFFKRFDKLLEKEGKVLSFIDNTNSF